jgi:hypothetical protein
MKIKVARYLVEKPFRQIDRRRLSTFDQKRLEMTQDALVDTLCALPISKQVHAAPNQAGHQASKKLLLKAEEAALQDDLGTNQITMEEYKRAAEDNWPRCELKCSITAKRALHEKIKSKKYRRICKKQRLRQKRSRRPGRGRS